MSSGFKSTGASPACPHAVATNKKHPSKASLLEEEGTLSNNAKLYRSFFTSLFIPVNEMQIDVFERELLGSKSLDARARIFDRA